MTKEITDVIMLCVAATPGILVCNGRRWRVHQPRAGPQDDALHRVSTNTTVSQLKSHFCRLQS